MNKSDYEKLGQEDVPNSHIGHGFEYTLYIGLTLIMLMALYVDFVM